MGKKTLFNYAIGNPMTRRAHHGRIQKAKHDTKASYKKPEKLHDTKAIYKNPERHKTHENIAGYKKPYTKSHIQKA